mmetsp:Transcript_36713/g.79982  ORF Transcript_36713/g.79982 Transcript_36713/m.79982 type:complete len:901 (+) Transcript_36713:245-2947(+)
MSNPTEIVSSYLNVAALDHKSVWPVLSGVLAVQPVDASDDYHNQGANRREGDPASEGDHGGAALGLDQSALHADRLLEGSNLLQHGKTSQGTVEQLLRVLGGRNAHNRLATRSELLVLGHLLAEAATHDTHALQGLSRRRLAGCRILVASGGHSRALAVLPERHADGTRHLSGAVAIGNLGVMLHEALQDSTLAVANTQLLGAHLLGVLLAVLGDTEVHLPVASHASLLLLDLLPALGREVDLAEVVLQAAEHTALARLDSLAVNRHLLGASLETGAQEHVRGLNLVQLLLGLPALGGELLLVRRKAVVNLALTRRDIRAELVHIILASLLQHGVVAEVLGLLHLGLEELLLAVLGGDVLLLLLQAGNHGATARLALEGRAHVGAELVDLVVASLVQPVVETVIFRLTDLVTLDLGLALRRHLIILVVLLQAGDDASVAVGHVLAEGLNLLGAGLLHGELEVNVLSEADLLVEQGRAALVAELLTGVLQAAQHPGGPGGDVLAQALTVVVARISEGTVETDILRSTLGQDVHLRLAALACQLLTVVLQTLDHAPVVAGGGVQAVLLVSTDRLDVIAALLTELRVQTEISRTPGHHLLKLGLAVSREVGLVAVLLKALLGVTHARLDILAELLLVTSANASEDSVELEVASILYLLAEELLLAVPGERNALLAKALLHLALTRLHALAQHLGVVLAQLVEHGVKTVVLGGLNLGGQNGSLARLGKLLLDLPEAGQHRAGLGVKSCIIAILLGVRLAGSGKLNVEVDVCALFHFEVAELLLAVIGQLAAVHVALLLLILLVGQALTQATLTGLDLSTEVGDVACATPGRVNVTISALQLNFVSSLNNVGNNGLLLLTALGLRLLIILELRLIDLLSNYMACEQADPQDQTHPPPTPSIQHRV